MKRLLFTSCMFLILAATNNIAAQEKIKIKDDKTKVKDENGKMKMKGDAMNRAMPYTALYSSNFVMGNPAHARMVLDIWKDWDDNALDRHNYFADTLVMYSPGGQVTKGREANLAEAKKFRGGLTSSKSTIDAWMPLRSTDRKEDWVAIWGTEVDTHSDGKVESIEIHEIWRINKDGKVDYVKQYAGKTPPQQ